ncbi:hypothetical protein FOXYSP1_20538 [Fusarium oxysporum f. sp. phaseoli]
MLKIRVAGHRSRGPLRTDGAAQRSC